MQNNIRRIIIMTIVLVSLLFILSGCARGNGKVTPPQDMLGTWFGSGSHSLNEEYLTQREIPFELIITKDGSLTGRVGDADISKTFITATPWYLKIIGKEKFRATVELNGRIVNQESFSRSGGSIHFLKISPDELECSFYSTGSEVNSNNLILPVKQILLRHSDSLN